MPEMCGPNWALAGLGENPPPTGASRWLQRLFAVRNIGLDPTFPAILKRNSCGVAALQASDLIVHSFPAQSSRSLPGALNSASRRDL